MKKEIIGSCEIYLGDSLEIIPTIRGGVDACITDPPYGIGFEYSTHDDSLSAWRDIMTHLVSWAKANASIAVMPSCQIAQLEWIYKTIPPDWMICWYKGSPGHRAFVGFNDWEPHLVYGKPSWLQMHDYFYAQPEIEKNGHPCPKPVAWAVYLISRTTQQNGLVIDPFLGSGTTLVGCAKLGRRGIGIEKDPKYFDIACKRIEAAYKQGDLFIEQPKLIQSDMLRTNKDGLSEHIDKQHK